MAIGVRFPEDGWSPVERIERLVQEAVGEYRRSLEPRLQQLRDAGIAPERISIVSFKSCAECHGSGFVVDQHLTEATHFLEIRECPTCPGLCVDGKPIARMGRQST